MLLLDCHYLDRTVFRTQEMGRFKYRSTVILELPDELVPIEPGFGVSQTLKLCDLHL